MALNQQQLLTQLKQKQTLAPIYLIHGDEILLRQELRDAIRRSAEENGYQAYQRFDIESHFNWKELTQACQTMSLFSTKTLIEVCNVSSKFDTKATKELLAYAEKPAVDKVLLIISGKLSPAQQKSQWVQMIHKAGIVAPIYPISFHELPRWISQRAQALKLNMDSGSIQYLAELTEGNLLASHQALIKLKLLYSQQEKITQAAMNQVAINSARFTVFELGDYILKGDTKHILTIMHALQDEGIEPTLILWLLTRELRQIISMQIQIQSGKSLQQVLASQWKIKQNLYKTALNRLGLVQAKQLLKLAHSIDTMIKGLEPGNAWQQLLKLSLQMAGMKLKP